MPYRFNSTLFCREACMDDISDMIELLRQLFSIEEDFIFNPQKHRSGLEMMLHSDSSKMFVAEKLGRVVGMCTLQILISTAEGTRVGLVEDVVVDERHRREGIGSLLLETLAEWAQTNDLPRLQLLADKDNIPALHFYAKHGWTSTNLKNMRKMLIH